MSNTIEHITKYKVFTKEWFKSAGVRAIKTVAQTAVSLLIVDGVTSMQEVNWLVVASASTLAGIISLLTSIAGLPEVTPEEKGATYIK